MIEKFRLAEAGGEGRLLVAEADAQGDIRDYDLSQGQRRGAASTANPIEKLERECRPNDDEGLTPEEGDAEQAIDYYDLDWARQKCRWDGVVRDWGLSVRIGHIGRWPWLRGVSDAAQARKGRSPLQ